MAEVELNIEKIIEEIKKTRFFSEYLPPAFLPKGRLDPFNMDLSEKPDLIEPLKFNMSRFSEDGKRRSVYSISLSLPAMSLLQNL